MSARPFDFDAAYGATYDAFIRRVVPGYEQLFPAARTLLSPAVGADGRVLVVGVGSGSELVSFAAARPGWRLTGVDLSEQMIAIAGRRLEERGLGGRVDFHHGDTATLPDGPAFDGATLDLVLHFLPDDGAKLALLQAIARRLRPGGTLVLIDAVGEPGSPELDWTLESWMAYLLEAGLGAEERATYRAQVEAGIHFVGEGRLRALLREAGFGEPAPFYRFFVFGGWTVERRPDGG